MINIQNAPEAPAPTGLAATLDVMKTAEIFREENLPLDTEAMKLGSEYNRIIGAQIFGQSA